MSCFRKPVLLLLICLALAGAYSVSAQCSAEKAKLGTLIRIGDDDGKKTPLILIHGLQGIKSNGDISVMDAYWSAFTNTVWKTDKLLQTKYTLFVFQYCSDRVEVSGIAETLRDLIDADLPDRSHVILAHSMGGLVATAYMADTVHLNGTWKGKTGGDTVIGLITLATPHHGTPGANSPGTLEKYIPLLYKFFYPRASKVFWESTLGKSHPAVNDSTLPNRADLRWDNYDLKFGAQRGDAPGDINKKLYARNLLFKKYQPKLIAYAGYLSSSLSGMDALQALSEMALNGGISSKENKHKVLGMANYFFLNGLGNNFGSTDGLVPFESGLFCEPKQPAGATKVSLPKNFICPSAIKVRRFEPGKKAGLAARTEYPDSNTLSIFRSAAGFDHLDMLEDQNVLDFVAKDLKTFATPQKPASTAGKVKNK